MTEPGKFQRRYTRPCLYCDGKVLAIGLCGKHWLRWSRRRPMEDTDPIYAKVISLHNTGYLVVSIGGRQQQHSRYVMERHLGRPLTDEEVVHHKNKIKTDDRIENLELFATQVEHMEKRHRYPRVPCRICGVNDRHQNIATGLCNKHYQRERRMLKAA